MSREASIIAVGPRIDMEMVKMKCNVGRVTQVSLPPDHAWESVTLKLAEKTAARKSCVLISEKGKGMHINSNC